ncbi:helix-turn-helix domain-containing protein [Streptomyces sp. NBC_00335]|uniref:helix-turn-helix domain-containing protein n=1 Tax=unclassified Streptomyces TaxID=2593676 RepID=UPI0022536A4A|nr:MULTISPECIES: helix-turn-helix domain-containing protein [unclassified Streptomyces]MCX5408009.1 helix-turn-helix domain-containing protein [Streptomyces sp. NBC_00086]
MERNSGTGRSAEAQAFARSMRELKERSGRSYGALARGLHTSTSTLHRYCSGEALPAEFVVVDRFARACGATPAEAVELHRAWLLADARRRAVSVVEAVEAVEVVEAVEAPPVDEGGRADPAAGLEAVAAEADVPGAPVPSRSGRRLRLAGAVAAAVVALAVSVWWLPQTGPDHRTPQAGPTAPAGATGTTATAGPTTSATGPGGTGPAATPTPTQTGPAKGSTGASAGASSGVTGTPAGPAATGGPSPASPPLRAAVRSHVWAAACDHAYLAEPAPSAVPPPPVEADAPAWAAGRGAVHAGTQIVEVTLLGTGPGVVVLEDLEVRVAGRRSPLQWNVYQMSQGCGGGLTPAGFTVNLDAPRPLARPVAGNNEGEAIAAPAFPLRVSATEPAVLRVVASSSGCDCDWYLDLRWSGPTGSGTLRLDEDGRPWRISAVSSDRPVYGYAPERGRWGR